MKVGYARTSSIDGSQRTGLETQIEILKRHGCERIFAEEQSGTSTEKRLQLKECLEFMREGDEFVFTMVDRVCRNSYDLQVIVKDLTDRGITLTATEQPFQLKMQHQDAPWICWESSPVWRKIYAGRDS